eukprot:s26_g70.t1
MSDEAKAKIRSLQKNDIPIEERRALYNSMARRFRNPSGLKPGLLQKYNACISDQRERFKLLKEESSQKKEDIYEKVPLFELQDRYGNTEGGKSAGPDFLIEAAKVSITQLMPDAEKTAAGTRTSAGGVVASKAQKAALGEAMDHQLAGMSKKDKGKGGGIKSKKRKEEKARTKANKAEEETGEPLEIDTQLDGEGLDGEGLDDDEELNQTQLDEDEAEFWEGYDWEEVENHRAPAQSC